MRDLLRMYKLEERPPLPLKKFGRAVLVFYLRNSSLSGAYLGHASLYARLNDMRTPNAFRRSILLPIKAAFFCDGYCDSFFYVAKRFRLAFLWRFGYHLPGVLLSQKIFPSDGIHARK